MKSPLSTLHARGLTFPLRYVSSMPGKCLPFLAAFLLTVLSVADLSAQRLGLHVTQAELNIWKKRAEVGPYRYRGYSSINSPGDWERIVTNANAFVKNPSSERWRTSTSGCVVPGYSEPVHHGEKLRDAAFAFLVTGNTTYRNAVRNELFAQIAEASTKFSNKNIWCDGRLKDRNPSFAIADWLTRLLFGYDYIRRSLTSSERQTIDTWFYHAGAFFQRNIDADLSQNFVNRSAGDYRLSGYGKLMNDSPSNNITHYNGFKTYSLAKFYNNRRSSQARFFALVGIQQGNDLFKNSGKRYVKEWLMFSTYPNGVIAEFERWDSDLAELGWSYASNCVAQAADIADHFARDGDMELYRFTTSFGYFGSAGGTKSLQLTIDNLLIYQNGTVKRYATKSSSSLHSGTLIDSKHSSSGWYGVNDIWMSQSNVFYRKTSIREHYTRRSSHMSQYPYKPASTGAHHPWGGPWDAYPGMLFMFGDMEGKVWPYPNATNPGIVPDPNSNNTITVSAYGPSSPSFRVIVNGVIIGQATAGSTLKHHQFTTKLKLSDIKTVLIHYHNDAFGRDLHVNSITVGSETIKSSSSKVKYDRYLLDGQDVIAGRTDMLWHGALVFKPSGSGTDSDDATLAPEPSSGTIVKVKAYGTPNGGEYAHFRVLINGTKIGEAYTTNSLKEYTFSTEWDTDDFSRLMLHFDNDKYSDGEDRNLYVKSVLVNGVEILSTASSTKYDRFLLDGKDVLSGREALLWPGYLIFALPSSLTTSNGRENFAMEEADPEVSKITDVVLAPNPNPGVFNLFLDMNAETDVKILVLDMIGNAFYEENFPSVSYRLEEKIELPQLPAGMYLLKVMVGEETVVKKFIKQ